MIKITRDAQLEIDSDISKSFAEKISKVFVTEELENLFVLFMINLLEKIH
jgi:hypothetical protein